MEPIALGTEGGTVVSYRENLTYTSRMDIQSWRDMGPLASVLVAWLVSLTEFVRLLHYKRSICDFSQT